MAVVMMVLVRVTGSSWILFRRFRNLALLMKPGRKDTRDQRTLEEMRGGGKAAGLYCLVGGHGWRRKGRRTQVGKEE